ncbi:Glucan 1,3-beta-glucosidase 3 [Serendipita sp. 398]|nr:Glucan 1,3-beta-glucosidase 3 [Serendipita sp. 398]
MGIHRSCNSDCRSLPYWSPPWCVPFSILLRLTKLCELDLHASPGAQNPDSHSGTGSGKVLMWEGSNRTAATFALHVLLSQIIKYDNIVGVELLNEPNDKPWLPDWYADTLNDLRGISPDIPLYVADAWHSEKYAPWAGARADCVIVDQHLYRCFTEEDRKKWGDQHAAELRQGKAAFQDLTKQCRGNFIIGEFSAALGGQPPGSNAGEHDRQRRVFAKAELELFEESCGGWFFWTLKKQEGWDAGWSLKNATQAEIMPAYVGRRKGQAPDDGKREQAKNDALGGYRIAFLGKGRNNDICSFSETYQLLEGENDQE